MKIAILRKPNPIPRDAGNPMYDLYKEMLLEKYTIEDLDNPDVVEELEMEYGEIPF